MNQYCRYCAFCFDMCDIYGCSNHPEGKELVMTRQQINRKNNCPNFALSDLGDVETGKPYRPLNKARITRLTKSDKEKQITIEDELLSRCDMCLNSRHIISENGFHTICCLSEKESLDCITGKKIITFSIQL